MKGIIIKKKSIIRIQKLSRALGRVILRPTACIPATTLKVPY